MGSLALVGQPPEKKENSNIVFNLVQATYAKLFVYISEIKLDKFYHMEYSDYCLHRYIHDISADVYFVECFISNSGTHTQL